MATQTADLPVDSPTEAQPPAQAPAAAPAPRQISASSLRSILTAIAMPIAAAVALLVHYSVPNTEPGSTTNYYAQLLAILLGLTGFLAAAQFISKPLRRWLLPKSPLLCPAILVLSAWQLITLKLALLPLPYFPGPELVMQTIANDWRLLLDCTWHSLFLLLLGYFAGVL